MGVFISELKKNEKENIYPIHMHPDDSHDASCSRDNKNR